MSNTTTCAKNGDHRLPAEQDSWNLDACDTIIAACLDRCRPCQKSMSADLTADLSEGLGRLFTTWVFIHLRNYQGTSGRIPASVLETMGTFTQGVISAPARKALRGVRLPQGELMAGGLFLPLNLDTAKAVRDMTAMTPAERGQLLGDVLDGILGDIALKEAGLI